MLHGILFDRLTKEVVNVRQKSLVNGLPELAYG